MFWSRPEEETALPRESPPAARMMMVQRKLLKSSLVRIPVPKKSIMGMIATTPMSPKTASRLWETHQSAMVTTVVMLMNHWTPENLSFTGLMGTMVVPSAGLNERRRRTQMRRIEMMHTGRATKNHTSQLGSGFMFCSAMIFCGDAIGEAIPPMFEARAIPRTSALENLDSAGRFLRSG